MRWVTKNWTPASNPTEPRAPRSAADV